MYKVYAFLKRHPKLSHDEYRAGHLGYYCGQTRRLKNIRGYHVSIWANQLLEDTLPEVMTHCSINPPKDFLDWWDGTSSLYFDDHTSWLDARSAEPNRATADGLVVDADWNLMDAQHLFLPVPDDSNQFQAIHLNMVEHVVLPVIRPEFKTTKIMQFFKRTASIDWETWRAQFEGEYLPRLQTLRHTTGIIANLRDEDQEAALRGFFKEDEYVFSTPATVARREFCALWDGAIELHFEQLRELKAARLTEHIRSELDHWERDLFASNWYVEVDESVVVNPNRDSAPDFYYR